MAPTVHDYLSESPFTLVLSAGFFGFYAHAGALYGFNGGDAYFSFGLGVDGKMFFSRDLGLYAFLRPFELGMNVGSGPLVAQLSFAGGLGGAF